MKTRFLAFWLFAIFVLLSIPTVDAHEIGFSGTGIFRITDETFDKYHMQTGEMLTIQGKISNNVEKDIRGWVSIFSESSNSDNRWEVLARDPPKTIFDVKSKSSVDYSITVKALIPGTYHVHTQFSVDKLGFQLGPGQTVVVEGESLPVNMPYTTIAYDLAPIVIGILIFVAVIFYLKRKRK